MTNYDNSQSTVSDISASDNKTSNTNQSDSYTSKIPLKNITHDTLLKTSLIAQKMKFSIKDILSSKCDQIRSFCSFSYC